MAGPDRPLRAAAGGAGASPPTSGLDITTGDAVADTPPLVAAALAAHPVVTNTWVLNYLSGAERAAYVAALDELGGAPRPVVGLRREPGPRPRAPRRRPAVRPQTALVLVRWRGGRRTVDHLGDAHPHGYWLHWQ